MKTCSKCQTSKSLDKFARNKKSKDGLNGLCKSCHAVFTKAWKTVNRAKDAENMRRWQLMNYYGITLEQYKEMLAKQNNVCAICERICKTGASLAVDHCHTTNRVRGLLCAACNRAIGNFQDSPTLLRKAATYLEQPQLGSS
jgi:hypothetical protein